MYSTIYIWIVHYFKAFLIFVCFMELIDLCAKQLIYVYVVHIFKLLSYFLSYSYIKVFFSNNYLFIYFLTY